MHWIDAWMDRFGCSFWFTVKLFGMLRYGQSIV